MKNNKSKIKKLISDNLKVQELTEKSEIAYVSRFLSSLLKEQENLPETEEIPSSNDDSEKLKNPSEFTPDVNKDDFEKSLDKDTKPDQFDVEGKNPESSAEIISTIREWSAKLDEFAEFLNDPAQNTSEGKPSLHKILADGDKAGSLLRGVTRKASDSITRIAGEVEKLKEILNTYIITAPKKLRDTEGQVAGWNQF
jgi:hypothetical protein